MPKLDIKMEYRIATNTPRGQKEEENEQVGEYKVKKNYCCCCRFLISAASL
jgi:hypothetical protein